MDIKSEEYTVRTLTLTDAGIENIGMSGWRYSIVDKVIIEIITGGTGDAICNVTTRGQGCKADGSRDQRKSLGLVSISGTRAEVLTKLADICREIEQPFFAVALLDERAEVLKRCSHAS